MSFSPVRLSTRPETLIQATLGYICAIFRASKGQQFLTAGVHRAFKMNPNANCIPLVWEKHWKSSWKLCQYT